MFAQFVKNKTMLYRIENFVFKHELFFGLCSFGGPFLYLVTLRPLIDYFGVLLICISWFGAFLLGDWLSRQMGEGSIFPHGPNQKNKLGRLVAASLIMNLILDITHVWFLKLWYYPWLDNILLYLLVFAPLGYILFGYIIYVFYRFFKHHWDFLVKPGRMSEIKNRIYQILIKLELIVGILGLATSICYLVKFVTENNLIWPAVNVSVVAPSPIWVGFLFWISAFFIVEYLCFRLKRETLTRDLLRGNFVPIYSILAASIICIVLVEIYNTPFQAWTFINWPLDTVRFFKIPLVAYLLWPMQFFLILPLIRLFDGRNIENVW
jgi:hypothetical protein